MEADLKVKVSKYISFLLRHSAQGLKMDVEGSVDLDELLAKLRERYPVDKRVILDIVEGSERRRFEVKDNRIRALYGHTISVRLRLEEDKEVKSLYHGTTLDAVSGILEEGLKPMKRRWVHLSPTVGVAREVGMRRTGNPVVLEIDAETAIRDGIRFYRATDKVYLCSSIPPEYVRMTEEQRKHREK